MDDAFLVCRLEGRNDLGADSKRFLQFERTVLPSFGERLTGDGFQNQEMNTVRLFEPINRGNIGVVQRCQQAGFPTEARDSFRIVSERLRRSLMATSRPSLVSWAR
jgi:hypothetical protein